MTPEARQRKRLRMLPTLHAVHEELYTTFPQTFFREPAQVQPLKKGITQDIRAVLSHSSYVLHGALHFYTARPAYLRAVAEGRPRIDLSGQCVGNVSPEEQEEARARLKARKRPRRGTKLQPPAIPAAEVPVVTTIPGSLP